MTSPAEKLAAALTELKSLQDRDVVAIRSSDLSRLARQRLIASNFLKEIIKGWYIPYFPTTVDGETTIWYSSFWKFCAQYYKAKFDKAWCVSPEQSLLIHSGNWSVPKQLLIRSPKASNKITNLLFGTSFFDIRNKIPSISDMEYKHGINVYTMESALIHCSAKFFTQYPSDARTILASIDDVDLLLKKLLSGDHSVIAGRLAGAFSNLGLLRQANTIVNTMQQLGYAVRKVDPFKDNIVLNLSGKVRSPYALRLQIMWQEMRGYIAHNFPKNTKKHFTNKDYLRDIDEKYVEDAYNSLSIEGYIVSAELIAKISKGSWNPDKHKTDGDDLNALAAYGYSLAFKQVKESIKQVLQDKNPGIVVKKDHKQWYKQLFLPNVTAGILKTDHLIGYRDHQVYIKGSHHVPPNKDALMNMMETFFDLLEKETEASVRIILGHFMFVYIHPYMDGNGRMGRFLMNVMCASGGYPWIIIPVTRRKEYMQALETASVQQDIKPFCDFIASFT